MKKAENRQNEIDRLFAKMYEDRACEKITERNFVMLSSKYQKEQAFINCLSFINASINSKKQKKKTTTPSFILVIVERRRKK
ncbi:hypothetical protein EfmJHP36_17930 [Enterococcus faecium]|nr:hypothetical protein EfmJHP36_17930 [Enterococcus faecium]